MNRQELILLMAATIAAPSLHDPRDGEIQHKNIFDRAIRIAEAAYDRHLGLAARVRKV
jgi:hypothetical protein